MTCEAGRHWKRWLVRFYFDAYTPRGRALPFRCTRNTGGLPTGHSTSSEA